MCVKKARRANVKVGLGTDVSGGYSPSMLVTIRHCISTSSALKITQKDYGDALTWRNAFYLATLGGSEALKLDDKIGNFIPGKQFDALIVNLESEGSVIDTFGHETLEEKIEKFIYLGDDRNTSNVFVKGRKVYPFN